MPAIDRDLAGDQSGAAAVPVFDNLENVMTLLRSQRLESPIIQDEELDAAERTHQPRIAAITAGQCQIGEHPRDALVEHRAIVATRLLTERAGKPALADPGWPFDDQVLPSSIQRPAISAWNSA